MALTEVKQLNRSFISSCTTIDKQDELTMYRLYGEDTKGVCLFFSVTNGLLSDNMLIKKISYARPSGVHPELDIIKKIVTTISLSHKLRFKLLYIDIRKHFFKSFDYSFENEVRLLFFDSVGSLPIPVSKGWVIAQPDKILSKFVAFGLSDSTFPLKLQTIKLGPNCSEKLINKRQFDVLLDQIGLSHVKVKLSKIESYRKT